MSVMSFLARLEFIVPTQLRSAASLDREIRQRYKDLEVCKRSLSDARNSLEASAAREVRLLATEAIDSPPVEWEREAGCQMQSLVTRHEGDVRRIYARLKTLRSVIRYAA